jgi:hypothetical protein
MECRLKGAPPGADQPGLASGRGLSSLEPVVRGTSTVPYAELHCHTNFSFLAGASPEASFLEMLDLVNEDLVARGDEQPCHAAFDHLGDAPDSRGDDGFLPRHGFQYSARKGILPERRYHADIDGMQQIPGIAAVTRQYDVLAGGKALAQLAKRLELRTVTAVE